MDGIVRHRKKIVDTAGLFKNILFNAVVFQKSFWALQTPMDIRIKKVTFHV